MTAWTRATTVASTLEDRFGLEKWSQRNIVLGLGLRQDLVAHAASCTPDDKKTLNSIAQQAEEAAKAKKGANLGSALHSFTERVDRGEDFNVIPPWDKDIAAYRAVMSKAQVEIDPHWIERVVVVPAIKTAGTLDRIVTYQGEKYIADVKTGSVDYNTSIAVQLAIYAGATHAWKGDAESVPRDRWGRYELPDPTKSPDVYEPMPEVNRERALVIHLPAGTGSCFLHWINIADARHAVKTAIWVRDWRKRKDLLTPLEEVTAQAANF